MQLIVGDEVVYPQRGVGRITGIESLDLVEGFERYFVIEFPDQGLTVRVPVRMMAELGVRPVMSHAKLASVLETLSAAPHPLPEDYRKRQEGVREKLDTGRATRLAEIVRDLTWREHHAHLTRVDTRLLSEGREHLSAEIASAANLEIDLAKRQIDEALAAALADAPLQ
jgi:CarD family transcriptional regulator